MKKTLFAFISSMLLAAAAYSANIVFDNETSYPNEGKIAVQWAYNSQEMQDGNTAVLYEKGLKQNSVQFLNKNGKVTLPVPANALYLRVLVWAEGNENPDLVTNWVDIVPNKTYMIDDEHLFPPVLLTGSGC